MPDGTPNNPNEPAQSWDRRPGETDSAWEAFLTFLNLGPTRDVAQTFQIITGHTTQPHHRFRALAVSYDWWKRAHAYDEWDALQRRRAREAAGIAAAAAQGAALADDEWVARRASARQTGWELSQELIKKAREMLSVAIIKRRVIAADPQAGRPETHVFEPAKWTMATLCQMVETADTLQRMACELPASVAEVSRRVTSNTVDDQPMFATSSGILEQSLPAGVVPAMPVDVTTAPRINIQLEAAASGLRQPNRMRPARRRPPGGGR